MSSASSGRDDPTRSWDQPRLGYPDVVVVDLEDFREHCLTKSDVREETPFGPDTLVFKVGGKIFAIASLDDVPPRVSLKCDPDRALDLRDRYEEVEPGYHLNKRHWNTVALAGRIPPNEIRDLIDHSYNLVVASLPKQKPAATSPGEGRRGLRRRQARDAAPRARPRGKRRADR